MEARIIQPLECDSQLRDAWESLVKGSTTTGVMQSLAWASFKQAQGLDPVHICVFEDDRLTGGALLYHARKSNGAGILVAPEGPVLPWEDERRSQTGLRMIMDAAEQYARVRGIMAMRVEPRIPLPAPRLLREFGRAPVDLVPRETLYIDLLATEPELLARMKPKGRYNIRLSQRHGVAITESTEPESVLRFYSVLREASQRDKFALEAPQFFQQLAGALCPAGIARFLFAEHGGDTLGAMLLVTYGTRATYLYGGITNDKRNLMGGYALQWEAIRAAKAAGCQTYDFYGFDQFGASSHAYARFSRFKRQFGGDVVRLIGAQDHFFLDSLADAFIKAVSEASPRTALQTR